MEGDLNPAYVSALAALAGATIGGMTSFATSWLTQRTQLRHAHRDAERAELKTLYSDFITEASRLFGDAVTRQTEEITGLVGQAELPGRIQRGLQKRLGRPRTGNPVTMARALTPPSGRYGKSGRRRSAGGRPPRS
jgi:hypothetical protein